MAFLSQEEKELLQQQSNQYFLNQGLSCGLTMLHCLSDYFKLPLEQQVYAALGGMMESPAQREQCGLYKGALMFLGIYCAQQGLDKQATYQIILDFTQSMSRDYPSLKCYELRGGPFLPGELHDKCAPLTARTVIYVVEYLLELQRKNK